VRDVQDHYFRQAKRDGYRSRAAYKLTEILDRKRLLTQGARVLDVGAAPGSWSQVLGRKLGARGQIVAIDLKPIDPSGLGDNVSVVEGDVTEATLEDLGGMPFDLIVSDMAPDTTGNPFGDHHRSVRLCNTLLDRATEWLVEGGALVMKVFEGEVYRELLARTAREFEKAKGFKPAASRTESVEMFIIATGYGGPTEGDEEQAAPADQLPKRKPSSGWSG
jgi:23S rRNA (uridine2552-2'-O)-methyltransferase